MDSIVLSAEHCTHQKQHTQEEHRGCHKGKNLKRNYCCTAAVVYGRVMLWLPGCFSYKDGLWVSIKPRDVHCISKAKAIAPPFEIS